MTPTARHDIRQSHLAQHGPRSLRYNWSAQASASTTEALRSIKRNIFEAAHLVMLPLEGSSLSRRDGSGKMIGAQGGFAGQGMNAGVTNRFGRASPSFGVLLRIPDSPAASIFLWPFPSSPSYILLLPGRSTQQPLSLSRPYCCCASSGCVGPMSNFDFANHLVAKSSLQPSIFAFGACA